MFDSNIERIYESRIKPNLKMIFEKRRDGLDDKHIAFALGISVRELRGALAQYDEFEKLYNDATQILISELSNVVIGRALGIDGRLDKDGELLPPDEKMAFELLKKLDPRYKDKIQVDNVFRIENVIASLEESVSSGGNEIIEADIGEQSN